MFVCCTIVYIYDLNYKTTGTVSEGLLFLFFPTLFATFEQAVDMTDSQHTVRIHTYIYEHVKFEK